MLPNLGSLAGRTIFITGASRGIGKAIALKCARDGANIVIAAKTVVPHPKLPGTIYTAAKEVEEAGGKCLPCEVDIRDEEQVSHSSVSASLGPCMKNRYLTHLSVHLSVPSQGVL